MSLRNPLVLRRAALLGLAFLPALGFAAGVDGGQVDAGAALDAGTTSRDGGAPELPPAPSFQVTQADGGPLELDGGVAPDTALRLNLGARFEQPAIRLRDSGGKPVAHHTELRLLADRTEAVLQPDAPLRTGTTFQLVVSDGATRFRLPDGTETGSLELRFKTSGEPPAPPPRRRRR